MQEVERYWMRSNDMDQARVIADAMPDHYWMFGPTIDLLKSSDRKSGAPVDNRRRQFGNMILSRYPIVSSRNHLLPKYTDPEKFAIQRGALETTIETPIGPVRFFSVHLCHLASAHRVRQVEAILTVHRRAARDGAVHSGRSPVAWSEETVTAPAPPSAAILLGDFNMLPGSAEYKKLVEISDNPGDDLVDAWLAAGGSEFEGATHYSDSAVQQGRRIDYCFLTRELNRRVDTVAVDDAADGSDHQPIRARFMVD